MRNYIKRVRRITVSLAYSPVVRTTRLDYRGTRLSFHLVREDSIEKVTDHFTKLDMNNADKVSEYSRNRNISSLTRNYGTLQSSTWELKQIPARARKKKFFVVVTRHDFLWAEPVTNDEENYSLVIRLQDVENENARLYQQVKQQLELRVVAKVQV